MKEVFIASSVEGLPLANEVAKVLRSVPGVNPILWSNVFPPSILTLEAIESAMSKVSGAVFIATPDVRVLHREQELQYPAPNVLFELGLFSARLGRANVALCTFESVTLPTDLKAFTFINLGANFPASSKNPMSEGWRSKLDSWARCLPPRLQKVPLTKVVHGYSGRWTCQIKFKRWREYDLRENESVDFDGILDISMPSLDNLSTAQIAGVGSVHGDLEVALHDYSCTVHVNDRVESVQISSDGGMSFWSTTQSRLIERESGTPPRIEGTKAILAGPKRFKWVLRPEADRHGLIGEYFIEHDHRDRASVRLEKFFSTSL